MNSNWGAGGFSHTTSLFKCIQSCQPTIDKSEEGEGSSGSLSAMRFITAVDMTQPQFLGPVSRELWMRIWSRDEDITQPESILAAAGEAGLPSALAQKLLAMTSTPEVKNRLKATTEEALNYRAFGMPALVAHVNGESHLFFGSDRLELLGNVIGEKWLGPVPAASKPRM
ncbi:unnamed protein product [Lepidochelys olivacea]